MRNIFLFIFAALFLSGCGVFQPKPEVVVNTEYVLVMPDDNLLVDCEVEPPPAKSEYLRAPQFSLTPTPADFTLTGTGAANQYAEAMKQADERERLQTRLNGKHYKNLGVCNARWAKLREFKANAAKELTNRKKE